MKRKVYLLDSGFNNWNENINSKKIIKSFEIHNEQVEIVNSDNDVLGHGTQIANIISKDLDIDLNVIKIFGSDYNSKISYLLTALKYILTQKNVYIVHMSLGVIIYNKELDTLCKMLSNKGVIMVSAFDNNKRVSYPAAFSYVVGVVASYRCLKADDFVFVDNSIVNVKAKGHSQTIVTQNNEKFIMNTGNSFAAAYVTREIIKSGCSSYCDAVEHIRSMAIYHYDYVKEKMKSFETLNKKYVVFPFNKENQSLLRYCDCFDYNIVDFYDIKYSGKVGTIHASIEDTEKYKIKNITDCDWNSFDTFILGHVKELSILCGFDYKEYILEKCLNNNKNVYMYDSEKYDEYKERFQDKGLNLYCASTNYTKLNKFGMLYYFRTPIVLFLGTSKKQGKFTLQLQFRHIMQKKGVKIAQIGTEPSSLIYGMEDMITTGYLSEGNVESKLFMEFINNKIHELDILDNQIITIGSQSAFLPQNATNAEMVDEKQFLLLFAAKPDGVILSINYNDSYDYIKRCINAIENLGKTKVFMLALYAFDMTTDYVIDVKKIKLSKKQIQEVKTKLSGLNLPIIVSGEEYDNESIFENTLKFFTKYKE